MDCDKERFYRYGLALVALLTLSEAAWAQSWGVKMFETTSHDFGTVARGAKAEYEFAFENLYEEEVHIASVRSSCLCTVAEIVEPTVKTWQKSAIKATVDTRGFLGRKDATITVTLDKPFAAEVQLHVYAFIRGDVVVQPGVVQFGNVAPGKPVAKSVQISYAGRNDWQITGVECSNQHVSAKVVETQRDAGTVKYDLVVTLDESSPAGYVQDHVVLVTNDQTSSTSRVPVPIEGIVGSAVTVRPSPLLIVAEAGRPITRQLVVQGRLPFRVTSVRSDNAQLKLGVSDEPKALHLVPVTFTAGDAPGEAHATVHLETDASGAASIDVPVQIHVMAAATSPSPAAGVVEH